MYAYITVCILNTIQKNTLRRPKTAPPAELLRTRFSAPQLLIQFRRLLSLRQVASWLTLTQQTFYWRAFTPLITLWYLVFQRLCHNPHLSHVQEDARAGGADRLSPRGKRLSQQLRSEATTSFSDARQRLPLQVCQQALRHIAAQSAKVLAIPKPFGLRIGLLDGSTCRLRPLGDIPTEFRAHRPGNCKKPPYWCLARVTGILCWATGIIWDSAIAHPKVSEQTLSAQLLRQRSWQGWLLAGDRNFGVYYVARALVAAQAHALLRLTEVRARRLARAAGLTLTPGLDAPIAWAPTRHDRCPEDLPRTPLTGRLLAITLRPTGFRPVTLYLFTTLRDPRSYPTHALAHIYGQRWHIELCFRYLKAQMGMACLECRSAEMARKEWLAGLIAYNLIRWTMGAAAALAAVPIQCLSFSRARELLVGWCLRGSLDRRSPHSWKGLLTRIAAARLPKRRKPRPSEPRAIRVLQKDFAKLEGSRAEARAKLAATNLKS